MSNENFRNIKFRKKIEEENDRNIRFSLLKQKSNSKIKSLIPLSIFLRLRKIDSYRKLIFAYFFDFKHYAKFSSSVSRGDNKDKLSGLLTMAYHNIEKGLSLKETRVMFGRDKIQTLSNRLVVYVENFGWDETSLAAINALETYKIFNENNNIDDTQIKTIIDQIKKIDIRSNDQYDGTKGGTKVLTKEQIHKNSVIDLTNFFKYRSSIRNFDEKKVDRSIIEKAIIMSQKTPSVCNRQTSRVIAFDDKDTINKLLELQGGARGFSENISTLLIISTDTSKFQSAAERYQGWIDGGLFSMSLIYALHSLGIGTCCLNWSKMPSDDEKLIKAIPELEKNRVIMFLAVGHIPDKVNVPISTSPPTSEIFLFKESINT